MERRVVRGAHRVDRRLQHLAVQTQFVAKVIVHRGDIRARRAADVTYGHLLETAVREQTLRGLQEAETRLAISCRRPRRKRCPGLCLHSVRLKSMVAALIATTEKISRNPRS